MSSTFSMYSIPTFVQEYLRTRSHFRITFLDMQVSASASTRTTKVLYINKECSLFHWLEQPFPHSHKLETGSNLTSWTNQSHTKLAFPPDAAEADLFSSGPGISSLDCSDAQKQLPHSIKCTELKDQMGLSLRKMHVWISVSDRRYSDQSHPLRAELIKCTSE